MTGSTQSLPLGVCVPVFLYCLATAADTMVQQLVLSDEANQIKKKKNPNIFSMDLPISKSYHLSPVRTDESHECTMEFFAFFSLHSEIIYVSRRYNEDTKLSVSVCI